MRNISFFLLALLLASCGNKTTETTEPNAEPIAPAMELTSYSIEDFYKSTSVGGGYFSPDGSKMLISSNETGIYNLFEIDLASGTKTQLSFSTQETYEPIGYMPSDKGILYMADKGGNELRHLYLMKDGESTDLIPGEEVKVGWGGWNQDHSAFYYSSTQRDPKFFDLYRMDVATMESEMLYEHDGEWDFNNISSDEKHIALAKSITTSETQLLVENRETKVRTMVSEPEKVGSYSAAGFSHDGATLYYLTDADGEFQKVMRMDLATGERAEELSADWDVSFFTESKSGVYKVAGINNDGRTEFRLKKTENGEAVTLPTIENEEILGLRFSPDESHLRLTVGSSMAPSNIYLYHMEADGNGLKQLTNTLNPEIERKDLVAAEVIRYKSFDGLDIPAIYYKPHTATANHTVPAILFIHGGPGGQSRTNYSPLIQYMVNQGYAVLAVNNRGSSGYGKSFYAMDDQNHGDKDLKDCIWAKKWLQEQEYIDGEKIGILGGSYGGYMTMAAMSFAPEEFEVGVNLFGVTNWLRTLKSIPPFWESFRSALYQEMGDPYTEDSVRLYNISPLFHADNIKNPVMVLQGANDPRVLQVESDEIVAAVKANNVPVEYVLFDDEGHGFRKKENEIEAYGKVVTFLDTYLKGTTAAAPETVK